MQHEETWKQKWTRLWTILWPIIVTQVGMYAMNLVDTMMSGQVGTEDLAGVAIGSSLWLPVLTGINGILLAVSPVVAQMIGKGEREGTGRFVNQALYVAVVLSLLVLAAGAAVLGPVLDAMGLEEQVGHVAYHYLLGLAIGIVPLFAANVLRNFFDAQSLTVVTMWITLSAVPVNALLNYMFIFGKFGAPAMGGIGAGYATAATYWLMLAVTIWATFRVEAVRGYRLFVKWAAPSLAAWKEMLAIGIPLGLSIFFEASIFSVVTLMMGVMFDTLTIAAHQIALSFASLVFMIPLSISMALTIVVGYSVGAGRLKDAKQYGMMGVGGGIGFLACCSVLIYFFREPIAFLYNDDPEVARLAASFLLVAILYQISDAAQASLQGVLRGYKDVQKPFFIAFASYWLIGIPSGYALASYTELGPYGFWVGIIIGLTCAAVGFMVRLVQVQRLAAGAGGRQPST